MINLLRKFREVKSSVKEKFFDLRDNVRSTKKDVEERVPLSAEPMSLEEVLEEDRESHVTFYTTENSEFAKGAEKSLARGIDKFGEKDTFDPDEADEHQSNRDRKQNSDLAQRFYTGGMDN